MARRQESPYCLPVWHTACRRPCACHDADAAAAEVVRLQQALVANRNELKGAYQQARRQQKRVQCCGLGPAAPPNDPSCVCAVQLQHSSRCPRGLQVIHVQAPWGCWVPNSCSPRRAFFGIPANRLAWLRRASSAEGTRLFGRGCNFGLGAWLQCLACCGPFLDGRLLALGACLYRPPARRGCPSATLREQVGAEVACALGCPPQSVETGGAQGPGSFKSEVPLDGRKRLQYFGPLFGSRFRTQKRVRVRCRIVFACTGLALRAPFLVPVFGFVLSPSIAAPFWMRRCCSTPHALSCKVNAFWRHLRYLYQKFADRDILMLNVDETSVGYTMKPRLGNVVAPAVRESVEAGSERSLGHTSASFAILQMSKGSYHITW